MNKCVFVIGPESSGSKLIAKICSHVLGIQEYGEWNGSAWSDKGFHKVCHRSLPYSYPPQYPNINEWILCNGIGYDIYFILTTRDITISELSRCKKYRKSLNQVKEESEKAKEIMTFVLKSNQRFFIWSYESFMFLQKEYLTNLYLFLGVNDNFIPNLIDGNPNKIDFNFLKDI